MPENDADGESDGGYVDCEFSNGDIFLSDNILAG